MGWTSYNIYQLSTLIMFLYLEHYDYVVSPERKESPTTLVLEALTMLAEMGLISEFCDGHDVFIYYLGCRVTDLVL